VFILDICFKLDWVPYCDFAICTCCSMSCRSQWLCVFAYANAGIVGSNLTQSMDVCVRLLHVCVVLRVGIGLATG
jgi:hypothetical protein